MKCYDFGPAVSITLKSKIRYNGQEYSSPAELPPEVRIAYEKALHDGAVKKRFVFNGEQFANEDAMPADIRKLCDDVMGVIENNGEVTIPNGKRSEPLLTKRELAVVALCAGGIVVLILARLARARPAGPRLRDYGVPGRLCPTTVASAVPLQEFRRNALQLRSDVLFCRCAQKLPSAKRGIQRERAPNRRVRPWSG